MATKINKLRTYVAPDWSADIPSGSHSGLTAGLFIGPNSSGQAVLADRRSAQGPIRAAGVIIHDSRHSVTVGVSTHTRDQDRADAFANGVEMQDSTWAMTNGATQYLSSGGTIQQEVPSAVGDIKQVVGFASATDKLTVQLGSPELITS